MPMKRIAQKSIGKADCGIACVAMVSNSSYEVAFEKLRHIETDEEFYTRHKDLIGALKRLGFTARQKRFKSFRQIKSKAIVATNKRKDGCWHWVVFDGVSKTPYIFDPKPEKKGKITDFRGLNGFGNYIHVSST